MAIAAQIPIPLIISKKDEHVGPLGRRRPLSPQQDEQRQKKPDQ
jgi:hypothetical protein